MSNKVGCTNFKKFTAGKRERKEKRKDKTVRSKVGGWDAYEKGASNAKFPPYFNNIMALE
jgi:hypothetical protein